MTARRTVFRLDGETPDSAYFNLPSARPAESSLKTSGNPSNRVEPPRFPGRDDDFPTRSKRRKRRPEDTK